MKISLIGFILVMSTVSCSYKAKETVYNMMQERERQECLKEGISDCPRAERFDKYNKQRDEVVK